MKFEELIEYQKEAIIYLENAKKKDRLVHAYLFEGDLGSGAIEAAQYFAMMMLCEEDPPCLKCNTCERIMYNSHLNVVMIESLTDTIKRDQIDYLMSDFTHTSLEKGPIIYIIKDAEKLNQASANALLKLLEEPAPNHYCILTTANHTRILDTIRSRCQYLHFKSVSPLMIEESLNETGVSPSLAYLISNLTKDYSVAKAYATEGYIEKLYTLASKIISAKFRKKDPYVEYILNKEILFSEHNKTGSLFLEIMLILLKELNKLKEHKSVYFEQLQAFADSLSSEEILKKIDLVVSAIPKINYHVNLDLLYSSLFLQL